MIPAFGETAERLRRSTVLIEAAGLGHGSGVIWPGSGMVVTNAHVAQTDRATVTLWDGRKYEAPVAKRDSGRDLAALPLAAPALEAAKIGDSRRLRPGEVVIAVGNPLGFQGALTTGVVHSVGPVPGLSRREFVQADVRLAPGNSGGPLADAQGRVIGINTMVLGRPVLRGAGWGSPGGAGIGLAVPAHTVTQFLDGGPRRRMGAAVRPVTVKFRQRTGPGSVILEIAKDSPAEAASLMVGDILVGVNGRLFETHDDLSFALEQAGPSAIQVQFLRGDRRNLREVSLTWH